MLESENRGTCGPNLLAVGNHGEELASTQETGQGSPFYQESTLGTAYSEVEP